ncbi:hypothetical protein SAMN05421753_1342, partial [Planctomicrobium piriforme]
RRSHHSGRPSVACSSTQITTTSTLESITGSRHTASSSSVSDRDGCTPGRHQSHSLTNCIAVGGRIGHHIFNSSTVKSSQQFFSLEWISSLSGRHRQSQQGPPSIHRGMQFGRRTSATASQATCMVGIFFCGRSRPVEAIGSALMLVESSWTSSRSGSPKACTIRSQTPAAHLWSKRFQAVLGFHGRVASGTPFSHSQETLPTTPV